MKMYLKVIGGVHVILAVQIGRPGFARGGGGGVGSPEMSSRGGALPGTRRSGRSRRYRGSFGLRFGAKESSRHV